MKSSVLVPVILVVCLLALALLLSRAFSAAQDGQDLVQGSANTSLTPKSIEADSADFYDAQSSDVAAEDARLGDLEPVSETRRPAADGQGLTSPGDYLVLAGTFRQLANAQSRVGSLQQAGFSATELAKFDRGTYAVALVSRSADYDGAVETARKVRAAGFEAKVYRKR